MKIILFLLALSCTPFSPYDSSNWPERIWHPVDVKVITYGSFSVQLIVPSETAGVPAISSGSLTTGGGGTVYDLVNTASFSASSSWVPDGSVDTEGDPLVFTIIKNDGRTAVSDPVTGWTFCEVDGEGHFIDSALHTYDVTFPEE